jgi:hypothetical protein
MIYKKGVTFHFVQNINVTDPFIDAFIDVIIAQFLTAWHVVGQMRFAETVCARMGIRIDTGKHGRPTGEPPRETAPLLEQSDFGF